MKNLVNFRLLGYTFLLMLLVLCTEDDPIQFRLTTNCVPEKTGTVTPETGMFTEGSEIELKATPNPEYIFKNWEGDAGGDENPLKITMIKDRAITAVFEKVNYSLSIEVIGEGTVDQKIMLAKTTSTDYKSGTIVELTANPENGWRFVEWSGDHTGTENPIQITMDQAMSISAKFERVSYTLSIEIEGNGKVTEEIIQAKNSSTDYQSGTTVLLTAIPDNEWKFVEWKGDYTGTANPLQLKMIKPRNITAVFEKVDHSISIDVVGKGHYRMQYIHVTPSPVNPSGSVLQLTAIADSGWYFVNWNGTIIENWEFFGDHIHTEDQIEIPLNDSIDLTVTFQEDNNNKTYIPDDNFEQALIDLSLDDILDDYVSSRKISTVEKLDISRRNIENLEGLQGFVSLQSFSCSENNISEIDLSNNPDIINLFAKQNLLSSLDLSPLDYVLFLDTRDNPLNCIQVNEMLLDQYENPGLIRWAIGEGVNVSLDCPD